MSDQLQAKKKPRKKKESKTTQDSDQQTTTTQIKKSNNQKKQPQLSPKRKKGAKAPLIKEDTESLLEYFKQQNRPFTINYLKDTLFLKLSLLQKSIDTLVSRGDIISKDVGSTKIFLVNQALMPMVNQGELEALSKELEGKTEEFKILSNANQKLSDQVKSLCRIATLQELRDQRTSIEGQIEQMKKKLLQYEDENFKRATPEETQRIEKDFEEMNNLCRKRRGIYKDAIGTILSESELSVAQFENIVGIFRE